MTIKISSSLLKFSVANIIIIICDFIRWTMSTRRLNLRRQNVNSIGHCSETKLAICCLFTCWLSCVDILFVFNFIFSLSIKPSCVCLNVCCNPAFLAAKSNKGYIILVKQVLTWLVGCETTSVTVLVARVQCSRMCGSVPSTLSTTDSFYLSPPVVQWVMVQVSGVPCIDDNDRQLVPQSVCMYVCLRRHQQLLCDLTST